MSHPGTPQNAVFKSYENLTIYHKESQIKVPTGEGSQRQTYLYPRTSKISGINNTSPEGRDIKQG